jgi:monoterpene epsilon-lactone hydrolase
MAEPPRSVSPEAAAFMREDFERPVYPPLYDHDGWRAFIREHNAPLESIYSAGARNVSVKTRVRRETAGDAVAYCATPADATRPDCAIIYLHMGGLVLFGGEIVLSMAVIQAARYLNQVYAVDFRVPPDHPFPAALDDCLAIYRLMLDRHAPDRIAILGDSGGANLGAALCLRARDEGLPLPASLVLRWPQTDLTESGDSFATNREHDMIMRGGSPETNALYLNGHDPADPYASPLFGDFAKGFPPTMLLSGTRDTFLSNTVRMHRALRRVGVETALHVFEAMPHGGFGHRTPEDVEARAEVRRFIEGHWPPPGGPGG